SEGMRGFCDSIELRVGELLSRAAVSFIEGTAGGHDLDDVDAAADGLPHHPAAIVGSVANTAPHHRLEDLLAQVVIVRMSVGRTDRITGCKNARSEHDTVANRIAQAEYRIARRAEVTHGGEPSHESRKRAAIGDHRKVIVGLAQ